MAFAPNGSLYVTVFGTSEEGTKKKPGKLIKFNSGLLSDKRFNMSNPSRREKVEAMLVENPNDTTLRYMLAMELEIEGKHERSLEAFGALIKESPAYIAAFFMSAKQLARLGRTDEAREILREGIREARLQGDTHAADQMSEYLTEMEGR